LSVPLLLRVCFDAPGGWRPRSAFRPDTREP